MPGSFKIATFNANSIRVRLPLVLEWLENEKPDALALQETKVTDDLFPREEFEKAGWHAAFRGQKSYNGVAFITRKPLEQVVTRLAPDDPDEEARFISGFCGGVRLINTYVPQGDLPDSPKFKKKLAFFAALKDYFMKNIPPDMPSLWMGDLNVAPTELDLWDPAGNAEHVCFHPRARKAFEAARRDRWTDLFREKEKGAGHYTFWDFFANSFASDKGWRIDLILGTAPMVRRLQRIWIDKEPRRKDRPSDHTFLAAAFEG
jgi:exodeoxyribonuclease III